MDKKLVGILIFVILIVIISGIKIVGDKFREENQPENNSTSQNENIKGLTTVYVATGGGKEGFVADEDINKILREKYKLNVVFDNWSNGKLVLWPTVREAIGKGNVKNYDKDSFSINNLDGLTPYDAIFPSDERYYNYYQLSANKDKGEADRFRVQGGSLTLNTPIVIYSWSNVTEALIKEGIVTEKDNAYFITDMPKLLQYISEKKKWSDIGLPNYGAMEIRSVDPVQSSPGATYYGLLLSIDCEGIVTDESAIEHLPSLKDFYLKAGALLHSPADLFNEYKFERTPLIVDYEKSIVNFANEEPDGFAEIKDDIRILYPEPTMWNSHCYEYFTDAGKQLFEALKDPEIQQIAWDKYGFRTGVTGGSYDTEKLGLGIPKNLTKTVSGLKMDLYDKLHDYLAEKDKDKAYNILHDITE